MILDYQTNSITTVQPLVQGLWRVTTRTDDTLFSAEVTLDIMAPALDIRNARLEVKRDTLGLTLDLSKASEKLVGVRVGPGMTKIVRGLIGAEAGSSRVAELVLEAMEMLVNALTVPELKKATQAVGKDIAFPNDGPKVFLNDRVIGTEQATLMAANPRLKDSCVVFRDL
ncbi:MAG: hypothetical protein AB1473_10850 [Thermodesulfobacteriota bacterium]